MQVDLICPSCKSTRVLQKPGAFGTETKCLSCGARGVPQKMIEHEKRLAQANGTALDTDETGKLTEVVEEECFDIRLTASEIRTLKTQSIKVLGKWFNDVLDQIPLSKQ